MYCPQQQIEVFDKPSQIIPVPDFAKDFQLTVEELFGTLALAGLTHLPPKSPNRSIGSRGDK